jgi:histidinol phosphatase-like PHP family hydrolase
MTDAISRRNFLAGTAAAGAAGTFALLAGPLAAAEKASGSAAPSGSAAASPSAAPVATRTMAPPPDLGFPIVDYHCHLDGTTIDKTVEYSKQRGFKFGIVEHAGTKENVYPVVLSSDDDLKRYMAMLEGKDVFRGVQAECIDWMTVFSKEAVARLDFVLSDALTFVEKDGHRVKLWEADKVKIDDTQDFMERYTAFTVKKILGEPIDIIAAATTLPSVLAKNYDALWTEERMQRIIDAAVKSNVAIEIGGQVRLPGMTFLKLAKQAGAKFSFASNGRGNAMGKLDYCYEAAKTLGLKREDMFTPAPPGKKPVEIRKFA